MMDEMICGVVRDGGLQIGKPLNVLNIYPIIKSNLRRGSVGRNLDRWGSKTRHDRVVGG